MLIFEKNLFYDCTKKELEEIAEAIKEDRNNGMLTFGMEAMKVQIERIRERFRIPGKTFDRVYYSSQKNVLVLTWKPEGNYKYYEESPKWECVFCDVDSHSPVVLHSDF